MIVKLLRRLYSFANQYINRCVLSYHGVKLGSNVIVNGRIYVRNAGIIELGDNVIINSGSRYNPVGGQTITRIIIYPGGVLRIGDGAGISNSTIVVQSKVVIGRDTMIGGSCNIWDTDFHSCEATIRGTALDQGKTRPIHIGESAFIGAHSILLKGSEVGSRAIVGAGSIGSLRVGDEQVFVRR